MSKPPEPADAPAAGRVLFVDDEPALLSSLQRLLRGKFDAVYAASGAEGLEALRRDSTIRVVVSDMRMPGMDGATFLARARELVPDVTRIMLTGNADQDTAVKAVNRGAIFRFLSKPCDSLELSAALHEGLELSRLRRVEADTLDRTLKGAVQIMVEIAATTAPACWRCVHPASKCAGEVARRVGVARPWFVELAALLVAVGAASLPDAARAEVADDATEVPGELAQASARLVRHVPRLEPVGDLLLALGAPAQGPFAGTLEARILQLTFAVLLHAQTPEQCAQRIATLQRGSAPADQPLLTAIESVLVGDVHALVETGVAIDELRVGMLLAQPILSTAGALLLPKGHTLTPLLLERIRNNQQTQGVRTPIWIL